MIDTLKYKPQIKRYLQLKGITISGNMCRCINPAHADKKPSAVIYEDYTAGGDPGVWCAVCLTKWDIFAAAGIICGLPSFKGQAEEVLSVLGEQEEIQLDKKHDKNEKLIPLDEKKAADIFNHQLLLERGKKYGWGNCITGSWFYKNESGQVEIIDVRFEGGEKKKNVVSFFYDGEYIKSKNCPIKVYNRDLIKKYPDHKRLIVEGAKTAEAGACLLDFGFTVHTWNGGSGKIDLADWSCFNGQNVFFFPDDDHEIDSRTKKEWPQDKQPGLKAALLLKKNHSSFINDFKIIPAYLPARKIKKSGADLVEILQLLSPAELAQHITESEPFIIKEKTLIGNPQIDKKDITDKAPFKILGTAEDKQSYFIDRCGHLYCIKLDVITKTKLQMLAPIDYWKMVVGTNELRQRDWDYIIDDIIEIAGKKDFDTDNIRGRGAWREKDGRICYHDGRNTYGEVCDSRVYETKTKIDIGINDPPASPEVCQSIKEIVMSLTFETKADAVRCLGWCALAPFGGCLEWRPPILVTGDSGSGKTTIANKIIRPLSAPLWLDGTETTPAYLRGKVGRDSRCVIFEETEGETDKQKGNREDLFTLMRISFSEDAPDSGKGTQDGGYRESKSNNMFGFIAIDPTMENVANENRIFRINMVVPKKEAAENYVLKIEPEIREIFTEKNCRAVRALTWEKIKIIIALAKKIAIYISRISLRDYRYSHAEAFLVAAYLVIFKSVDDMEEAEIIDTIKQIITLQPPEEKRDQAEEIIETIFEEKIKVFLEKRTLDFSVSEIIDILRTGETSYGNDMGGKRQITQDEKIEFRRAIELIGVYEQEGLIGIANNHKEIRRIIKRGRGYARILRRHKKCVSVSRNINRNGIQKKCSMFDLFDVLKDVPF